MISNLKKINSQGLNMVPVLNVFFKSSRMNASEICVVFFSDEGDPG